MRSIKYLVVHCTATPQATTIESIKNHWANVLGWKTVGYHYIIKADGQIVQLQPIDKPTNGVKGYNKECVHVCYIGGMINDNRTKQQKAALTQVLTGLKQQFPTAIIQGHRDFPGVAKACPQFDAKNEYKNL